MWNPAHHAYNRFTFGGHEEVRMSYALSIPASFLAFAVSAAAMTVQLQPIPDAFARLGHKVGR